MDKMEDDMFSKKVYDFGLDESEIWLHNIRWSLRFHRIDDLKIIGTTKILNLYAFNFHCETYDFKNEEKDGKIISEVLKVKHRIILNISYNDKNKKALEIAKKEKSTVFLRMNDIDIFEGLKQTNLESLPEAIQFIIKAIYMDAENVYNIFKDDVANTVDKVMKIMIEHKVEQNAQG